MIKISEQELKKLYYSIGEVADMFDVNTSLIRFWEKEFQVIKPKKNNKGNRLFTPKDIVQIDRIYHLVKEKGFTLEGAKKSLKEKGIMPSSATDNGEIISRLESMRKLLLRIKS